MSLIEYDAVLVEEVASRLDLRAPNAAALHAVVRALDAADQRGVELVCDLATGTGKTYIAAGIVEYLAELGHRDVLILCHRNAILNKTRRNFTPGDSKFVAGLSSRPEIVTVDTFRRQQAEPTQPRLYLFNVQQLLQPTGATRRRTRDYDETLGLGFYQHLASLPDLVVIADEHHVYFGPRFSRAIQDLGALAVVGLTATPNDATDPTSIIYRYTLAEAIADEYVKVPVLVGRRGSPVDLHRILADGVRLLDTKQRAVDRWCGETGSATFNAVLFVVCESIAESEDLAATLARPEYFGDADAVLTVNSDSPEEALERLEGLENADSKVRAVVSVQMLQEGWDVRNIYVVATTRALESRALSEQILGRGLRLPFGRRTGQQMLDTVEVLSHRRFRDILANAGQMLEAFFTDRHETALLPEAPTEVGEGGGRVDAVVTPTGPGTATGDGEAAFGFELVDADTRIDELGEQEFRLTHLLALREGVSPVRFPRVTTAVRPAAMTLTDLATELAVETGRRFRAEIPALLQRELVDVERVDGGTRIAARAADEAIEATQLTFGMDALREKIQRRVLDSRYVERTRQQARALDRLIDGFLEGAASDDTSHWGEARIHAAVEALLGLVSAHYAERRSFPVEEVTLLDYPRTGVPAPSEVFNKSTPFVAHRWYDGWNRNMLDVARFDARSTEFAIAEILDSDPSIDHWCRVEVGQEVAISYGRGRYYPDFVAVESEGTHWLIEGKADASAMDEDVVAKRDAAELWTRQVHDLGESPDVWRYMFATESAIRGAGGSWRSLVEIARTT